MSGGGGCENLGMLEFLFLSVMALRGILFKTFPCRIRFSSNIIVTLTEKIFKLKFVYQKIYTVICGKYARAYIWWKSARFSRGWLLSVGITDVTMTSSVTKYIIYTEAVWATLHWKSKYYRPRLANLRVSLVHFTCHHLSDPLPFPWQAATRDFVSPRPAELVHFNRPAPQPNFPAILIPLFICPPPEKNLDFQQCITLKY